MNPAQPLQETASPSSSDGKKSDNPGEQDLVKSSGLSADKSRRSLSPKTMMKLYPVTVQITVDSSKHVLTI